MTDLESYSDREFLAALKPLIGTLVIDKRLAPSDNPRAVLLGGQSGAGKTTLFNCLNRDIKTDSGNFYIDTDGVRREVTADDIGYVLSTPTVPEFLTGREFLKFFMDINEKSIKNPKSTWLLLWTD